MKQPTMKQVIETTCQTEEEARLFRAVMRQMSAEWSDIWEYPENYRDAGLGVGGFIYYGETEIFAKRNMPDILAVLWDFEEEIGEPLKKDTDNPLNWLAWFALESIIQKVMDYKDGVNDYD